MQEHRDLKCDSSEKEITASMMLEKMPRRHPALNPEHIDGFIEKMDTTPDPCTASDVAYAPTTSLEDQHKELLLTESAHKSLECNPTSQTKISPTHELPVSVHTEQVLDHNIDRKVASNERQSNSQKETEKQLTSSAFVWPKEVLKQMCCLRRDANRILKDDEEVIRYEVTSVKDNETAQLTSDVRELEITRTIEQQAVPKARQRKMGVIYVRPPFGEIDNQSNEKNNIPKSFLVSDSLAAEEENKYNELTQTAPKQSMSNLVLEATAAHQGAYYDSKANNSREMFLRDARSNSSTSASTQGALFRDGRSDSSRNTSTEEAFFRGGRSDSSGTTSTEEAFYRGGPLDWITSISTQGALFQRGRSDSSETTSTEEAFLRGGRSDWITSKTQGAFFRGGRSDSSRNTSTQEASFRFGRSDSLATTSTEDALPASSRSDSLGSTSLPESLFRGTSSDSSASTSIQETLLQEAYEDYLETRQDRDMGENYRLLHRIEECMTETSHPSLDLVSQEIHRTEQEIFASMRTPGNETFEQIRDPKREVEDVMKYDLWMKAMKEKFGDPKDTCTPWKPMEFLDQETLYKLWRPPSTEEKKEEMSPETRRRFELERMELMRQPRELAELRCRRESESDDEETVEGAGVP